MSTLSEDGITTDDLLALCRRRVTQWEAALLNSRAEHEAAEAFTRAFAELDEALSHQHRLPQAWEAGRRMELVTDDPDGIYPVAELLGDHVVRVEKKPGEGL